MRRLVVGFVGLVVSMLAASPADAQGTVKIGLILPYSGQFADTATQMDNGIKLYLKKHGDTVAGKKIEIIRKDTGGPSPDVAKRLAQELVVRDGVDILAGFVLTPNALAASDVSDQAKKLMVIMNAATSIITTKSAYSVRTSLTLPQVTETLGAWAHKSGVRKVYTMVSDYGPGHDAEGGFHRAFKAAGGEIIGSVRFPVANPDFSAFVQRAKDLNPESIFIFVPGGAQPAALAKALAERGHRPQEDQGPGDGRGHRRDGGAEHGRRRARHHHRLALRLQPRLGAEQGVRPRLRGGRQGQPELLRGRRLRRDAPHLRGAEEDRRQDRRREPDRARPRAWRGRARGARCPSIPRPATSSRPSTSGASRRSAATLVNVEFDKVENVKDPVKAAMKK